MEIYSNHFYLKIEGLLKRSDSTMTAFLNIADDIRERYELRLREEHSHIQRLCFDKYIAK